MKIENSDIKKAMIRSQHCQRNWDLSKTIPEDDLDLLKASVTQAPSLQNAAFYRVHWIEDRETIERVHSATHGAPYKIVDGKKIVDPHPREEDHLHEMGDATQSQTLANVVVVFEEFYEPQEWYKEKRILDKPRKEDTLVALGIASGYLNLVASMLGYSTGCCQSFKHNELKEALNLENEPLLIMGVGIKNEKVNRRVHQLDKEIIYPTCPRQSIPIVEY